MRLRIIVAFALLLSLGLVAQTGPHRKIFSAAGATWTFDSVSVRKTSCGTGTATCTTTLAASPHSTGSGEVILLSVASTATGHTISSATVGGTAATLVASSACHPTSNVFFTVDCAYVIGPAGTAVSVTIDSVPGASWSIQADGAYKSSGSVTIDQVGAVGDASGSTSHVGPTLTSSNNDIVFQIGRFPAAATAINNSYNSDLGFITGINVAYKLNVTPTASTPATWTTSATSQGNESAISFQ